MAEVIRSPANPEIKRLHRLRRADERRLQGRFIAEGRRAIDGVLAAGLRPLGLFLREDLPCPNGWPEDVLRRASAAAIERASTLRSPPGQLAEFPLPAPAPIDPELGGLLLDGLADPGNLGSVLRSAAAFGIGQVLLCGGADPWAPKVVQGSAGTLAALRLATIDEDGLGSALGATPLLALVPSGGLAPERWPGGPAWLVLGSEAHGIGPTVAARVAQRLSLPMAGPVESLNAAVAAGIACYLLMDKRR